MNIQILSRQFSRGAYTMQEGCISPASADVSYSCTPCAPPIPVAQLADREMHIFCRDGSLCILRRRFAECVTASPQDPRRKMEV